MERQEKFDKVKKKEVIEARESHMKLVEYVVIIYLRVTIICVRFSKQTGLGSIVLVIFVFYYS